jgi:hypothetical protein
MKVVLISPVTPYKENMGGPSGHPYHLMIERPLGIDIVAYTYNQNHLSAKTISEVEKELDIQIKIIELPWWYKLVLRLHLTFIRLLLKFPINYYIRLPKGVVTEIRESQPDLIWGYCQEFSGILSQFKEFKRLHTVPDSYCLHWYRRLGRSFTLSHYTEYLRVVMNYRKYYRLESTYDCSENILCHFVGEADALFVRRMLPAINAQFLRHPHYEVEKEDRKIEFHQPKIRLLLAGRYDLYSYEASNELFSVLAKWNDTDKSFFSEHFELTILGKGWQIKVDELRKAGLEVKWIDFVPDYTEEIIKYDIQINPLSVGTGTKGKVLDAIANGLLEIGTPYALENIAVENRVSCIVYQNATELISILKHIAEQPKRYAQMARLGRESVLKYHNRCDISKELFSLTNFH